MSNLIETFAEKSSLTVEQSEKVMGGAFAFLRQQMPADLYSKVVAEIPEAETLGNLFMNAPVAGVPRTEEGLSKMMGGQFAQMMKMMTELQKAGVGQERLQKLTPIAFAAIGTKLSDETKAIVAQRMPMFKDMIYGNPVQKPLGFGALANPFFGKK